MKQVRRGSLHTHSSFSDGANSMEEMTLAAIDKGFAYLGFSEHSYTAFTDECCIAPKSIPAYFAEARRLRETYAGRIELYVGFENDYYGLYPKEEQGFTIGSVHYLRDDATGTYCTVDHNHGLYRDAIERIGGGDIRRMVARYYDLIADLAKNYRPDIIGHIDLVTKLNADGRYFDEGSDWYRAIVMKTCERIAATGIIVELNTGAIARGYRAEPYPGRWILELLRELRVPVTISSDSHSAETLDFWFDESEELLRGCGFRSVRQLSGGEWIDVSLS